MSDAVEEVKALIESSRKLMEETKTLAGQQHQLMSTLQQTVVSLGTITGQRKE